MKLTSETQTEKRRTYLKKYNYYDDEVTESKLSEKIGDSFAIFCYLMKDGVNKVKEKCRGKRPAEIIRYVFSPKRSRIKLIAVILFIVTIFCFIFGFAHSISKNNQRTAKYYTDAGAVCTAIISKYGPCKTDAIDEKYGKDLWQITGLSYARQMDFDGDGSDELLAAYNDGGEYYYEVWGYDGRDFVKFYSDRANTAAGNELLGSWITIYRHRGKYYLGKNSEEEQNKMDLLSLKGNKFKENGSCEYDAEKDIYAIKGNIDSLDFETIKLSFISSAKAEKTVDIVSANIEEFDTEDIRTIESEKTPEELKAQAYYEIIERYNEKYGKGEYNSEGNICYADGLAVVDLVDFNNDSNEELMLVFRRDKKIAGEDKSGNYVMKTEPEYRMEVYCWNGASAKKIYENDGLSAFQNNDNDQVFYILQNEDGKINICDNSYTVSENSSRRKKFTSRISTMTDDGRFETAFVAVINNNYGEMTYSINGERVYRREFNKQGYAVPYFCNEDEYDKNKFTVTVLQGRASDGSTIRTVINETVKTIKQINPNYSE